MDARYGMTIPLEGLPLPEQRAWIAELAQLGYDDVWTAEATDLDGFTPLVLASQWAPSLGLGTAIIPASTRGPALLAQSVAALADVAPGRVVLGVGSSSNVIVQSWNGIAFERPLARTRDVVRFLRRALAGERVDEVFETFAVSGFRLARPPASPVPILVAALRPAMLRMGWAEGDGVILNWLSAADVARVRAELPGGGDAAAAGKQLVVRLFVVPSEDPAHARAVARRHIAAYLNVPVYAAFHRWLGRGEQLAGMWAAWDAGDRRGALAAIPDEVVDDLVVHGSAATCWEQVRSYVEAGVTAVTVAIVGSGADALAAARALGGPPSSR